MADLSELGGPEAVPLESGSDGNYRLEPLSLAIEGPNGFRTLPIMIDQQTSLGPYWTQLSRQIAVLPAVDVLIFDEVLSPGWQEEHHRTVETVDLVQTGQTYKGQVAGFFQVRGSFGGWNIAFRLAGQQVVKLVEGVREAGSYTLRWDGRDGNGRELASGVYLYRLRAGERMETRKLMVLH